MANPSEISKPNTLKPESDDSYSHALNVFAQSLAYSALEAPARGIAQLTDHTFGTKYDEAVKSNFAQNGIQKPDEEKFGTNAWKAEQFGNAIGMIAPMMLSRKLMVGKTEHAVVSVADKAFLEAQLSAKTGLFYGAALTPSDDNGDPNHFFQNRVKQGLNSTLTFGAMGYSSSLTGAALSRTASLIESSIVPTALKTTLQSTLTSSFFHGALSGLPGGAIQAQLNAMENGKTFASLQDIKENVISMSMVGGAMGGAQLFKTNAIESGALTKVDTPKASAVTNALDQPDHTNATPHPFDIKFDPITDAWNPLVVSNHTTLETRTVEFTPENQSKLAQTKKWSQFREWGVDKRDVPVNVYRFPGLTTEIVVPSDYAQILDQVRAHRYNAIPYSAEPGSDPNVWIRSDRILPEEMAQALLRLPQPDLVKTVQLLDHGNPWDAKITNDRIEAAAVRGEIPGARQTFISQADARTNDGAVRFFDVATNKESEMQDTTPHEWAHLLENEPVYNAFEAAAHAERNGFFARDYAHENDQENWAVHLGERFLSPEGAAFAELPEKAPARTLVMAKAVRHMLKERAANPTSRHQEFLARVEAAEQIASTKLQQSILDDLSSANHDALADKLKFLNVAATLGRSPEIFDRVLTPIKRDLMPLLYTHGETAQDARRAFRDSVDINPQTLSTNKKS